MITGLLLPLALAFIMFAMGLTLRPADFRLVLAHPKAVALGLLSQMLVLPVIALAAIWAFQPEPPFAVGLIILAACPGGITSNLLTHLAGGATALAVSLTAVTSMAGTATIPIIVNLALLHLGGYQESADLPMARMTMGVFAAAALPMLLAMIVKANAPALALRAEKIARPAATALFAFIVAAAFASQWPIMTENAAAILPPAFAVNAAAMAAAWGLGHLGGLSGRERLAVIMETGLQNGALGIFVAATLLHDQAMMVPSIVYALVMNITALAVILWVKLYRQKKGGVSPAFPKSR